MSETTLREPAYLVLTALAAEPQHGYAVIEDVHAISGGRVRLHTGSLYAILDRLQQSGLIEVDHEEIVASRLRRYYRLTGAGVRRLTDETEALRRHADAASARLRRVSPTVRNGPTLQGGHTFQGGHTLQGGTA